MFASLDQHRFAKLYKSTDGKYRPIALPDGYDSVARDYNTALSLPTRARAERLAQRLDTVFKTPSHQQVVVAVFFLEYAAKSPPEVTAKPIHMVSSKPHLTTGELRWKW